MLAALRQSALSRAYCSGLIHTGLQGRPCLGLCRCSSSSDEPPGPQDRSSRRRRQQPARQQTKTTKSSKPKGSKAQTLGEDTAAAGVGQAVEQVSLAPAPAPGAAPPAPPAAATPPPVAADGGCAAEQPPLSHVLPLPEPGQPQYPDAPFQLREYQLEAISAIIRGWKEGNNAQLVMLPTGCGKTVVFAALARYFSQHFTQQAAATPPAPVLPDADSSADAAAAAASARTQQRGAPTVAAASTTAAASRVGPVDGTPVAAAAGGDGSSNSSRSKSKSKGSSSGDGSSSSSSGSRGEESPPEPAFNKSSMASSSRAASRLQRLQEALGSLPSSQAGPQGPSAAQLPSSTSSTAGSSAAQPPDLKSSDASTIIDDTCSAASSSSEASSDEDGSRAGSSSSKGRGKGKRGRKPRQEQQQPQVSQQEQQLQEPPPPQQQPQQQLVSPGPRAGGMRVLVLAHRQELLHQAEEKFRLMWGNQDLSVSWVKGKRKEFDGQVVVASVATAVNCIPTLAQCNFSLVIVDEAHHSVANTYKDILQGLGLIEELPAPPPPPPAPATASEPNSSPGSSVLSTLGSLDEEASDTPAALTASASPSSSQDGSQDSSSSEAEDGAEGLAPPPKTIIRVKPNPHTLLLGFTATPYRLKKAESEDLYSIFPSYTYARTIQDMIRAGHLAQVRSEKVLTQTDLKGALVGTSGDFSTSKLSRLVNHRSRNQLVLAAYLEHCTEPAPSDGSPHSPEQWQEHEERLSVRGRQVNAALQIKSQRQQGKFRSVLEQRAASSSPSWQPLSGLDGMESVDEGHLSLEEYLWQQQGGQSFGEEDSEEEEEEEAPAADIYPLPADVDGAALTGGLSMAGRRALRRKTIAFAVDIQHAEAMNAAFNVAGVRASAIHSLMPHDIVKAELSRFRAGELEVLFNVEVLTEGFDEPSIDAILMARPTRSEGLYTQMLGRGLRIMPGKRDCLVLDFTDKYHQAGKVIDTRVLLPDLVLTGDGELPAKGPAKIDEDAKGGKVDVVESGLQPEDLAWRSMGPHWMTSLFSGGNIWLVNTAGMGARQRALLGLGSAPVAQEAVQGSSGLQLQPQPQPQPQVEAGGGEDSSDEDEGAADDVEDRYVILHQQGNTKTDPTAWTAAFKPGGHSWSGFAEADALGAALTYIERWARDAERQAVMVGLQAKRRGFSSRPVYLSSFAKDARWRRQPASDKQKDLLETLKIQIEPTELRQLTKGQASDLISAHKAALASPDQLRELQESLDPAEFEDLPVPLLKEHADKLLR